MLQKTGGLNEAPHARKSRRYRFDIKRLSADCEANYARLCSLLPGLGQIAAERGWPAGSQRALSVGSGAVANIDVLEQCPFTTVLQLRFSLLGNGDTVHAQSGGCEEGAAARVLSDVAAASTLHMQVRLYHDVRMAEVITVSGRRSALASYDYPNAAMFQPDEKAQQNRFLAEWLGRILRDGQVCDEGCDTGMRHARGAEILPLAQQ